MENNPPRLKINLYVQRDFGEKVTATFRFMVENWKPLLKYFILLMLPLSILHSFFLNEYTDKMNVMNEHLDSLTPDKMMDMLTQYGLMALVALLAGVVLLSFVYGLMQVYARRDEPLSSLRFEELKPYLLRNLLPAVKTLLLSIVCLMFVAMVVGVFVAVTPATLFITLPGLLFCLVPLTLFIPCSLLNERGQGCWSSLLWSFRQGTRFWGSCAVLFVVVGILGSILQGIVSIPWYALSIFKMLVGEGGSYDTNTIKVLMFFSGIFYALGTYISSVIIFIASAYQYGHICEKTEAVSVDKDIRNFEQF